MENKQNETKKVKLPLVELNDSTLETLLNSGVHFGHQTQRWDPRMKDYIYTTRDGIHIIDLIKSVQKLNEAIEAAYNYSTKGEIIFVGVKPQAKEVVKKYAQEAKSHFVINRWPGGLLTNYLVTRKSIKKLNDYIKGFKEGIENRTKKELLKMREELSKLDFLYGGVKMLNKKPACLIALDTKKSAIAIREAHKMGIPVIAIVDTNASPEYVDHVIPANDDAISSLEFIAGKLAEAIRLGNEGNGIEYFEVNFDEVDQNIQNMSKMLEDKKKTQRYGAETEGGNKPRVIRVSREQMNRSKISK